MGKSSSQDASQEYFPYRERQDWIGFVPLDLPDEKDRVVPIAYSQEYREAIGYFRACMSTEEISLRCLTLTEHILNLNAGHYTVWWYRRKLLENLEVDLNEELDKVRELCSNNPKNYQLWHHRNWCLTKLAAIERKVIFEELADLENAFEIDSKNYHAWTYRQSIFRTFNIWNEFNELKVVESLIEKDIRNNSAWNQRYFWLTNSGNMLSVMDTEFQYTIDKIKKAPHNESSWAYLKGLLTLYDDLHEKVVSFLIEYEKSHPVLACAWAFQVEYYSEFKKGFESEDIITKCEKLINELDTIRANYWRFIKTTL